MRRAIPGARFEATRFAVREDENRYPFHGQTIEGVRVVATDRAVLDSPEMGLELLATLKRMYPGEFRWEKAARLVVNAETMEALGRGEDPRVIAEGWRAGLEAFRARRAKYLLYP